jgi:hypothetical protein
MNRALFGSSKKEFTIFHFAASRGHSHALASGPFPPFLEPTLPVSGDSFVCIPFSLIKTEKKVVRVQMINWYTPG